MRGMFHPGNRDSPHHDARIVDAVRLARRGMSISRNTREPFDHLEICGSRNQIQPGTYKINFNHPGRRRWMPFAELANNRHIFGLHDQQNGGHPVEIGDSIQLSRSDDRSVPVDSRRRVKWFVKIASGSLPGPRQGMQRRPIQRPCQPRVQADHQLHHGGSRRWHPHSRSSQTMGYRAGPTPGETGDHLLLSTADPTNCPASFTPFHCTCCKV